MLDTNAVIGYLADDPALVACIDRCGEAGADMALATISIVELLGFPALTAVTQKEIDAFLDAASLIALTPSLARDAARLRRAYRLTSADAVIAATALHLREPLITRDRAFAKVTEIECVTP